LQAIENRKKRGSTGNKPKSSKEDNVENRDTILQIPKHLIARTASSASSSAPPLKETTKAKTSADYATEVERLQYELEAIKAAAECKKQVLLSESKSVDEKLCMKRQVLPTPPISFTAKRSKTSR
jgi:hypothetical protein